MCALERKSCLHSCELFFHHSVLQLLGEIPGWYQQPSLVTQAMGIPAVPWSDILVSLAQSAESCRGFFAKRPFHKIARAAGWTPEIGETTEHVPTASLSVFFHFIPEANLRSFLAITLLRLISVHLGSLLVRLEQYLKRSSYQSQQYNDVAKTIVKNINQFEIIFYKFEFLNHQKLRKWK